MSSTAIAYLAVILIWSTTPLGIVWSSESIPPTMAVLLRMLIAITLGMLIIKSRRIILPWHKQALKLYSFSALGIFGGMLFSYMSAKYISSGVMSLIFGLSPVISALLAQKIANEAKLSKVRLFSMFISLAGLAVVCANSFTLKENSIYGLAFILIAVFFFSLSGVLVKTVHLAIHPMATTVGSLTVSVPLFFISWLVLDGSLDTSQWQLRSIAATVYLGIFGSLIGFYAYFYVLQKLTASTVTLVTLITPVMALSLGAVLNNEIISFNLIIGAFLVLFGLTLYHFGEKLFLRKKALKQTEN
ncbi:MAG: DMT family transporter [Alteromonadaceae bacterium]|nr:DMT family transporter [Alteromonadaceae bacterium]